MYNKLDIIMTGVMGFIIGSLFTLYLCIITLF